MERVDEQGLFTAPLAADSKDKATQEHVQDDFRSWKATTMMAKKLSVALLTGLTPSRRTTQRKIVLA